ncbi:MAG: hypothetical protein KGI75_09200 [Rhizobiaceae bacterium]|nr:hypothetical protein [Rhizobiaceae bacterium]
MCFTLTEAALGLASDQVIYARKKQFQQRRFIALVIARRADHGSYPELVVRGVGQFAAHEQGWPVFS